MRAVIGLGNPGSRYFASRHNIGFWVLERLLRTGKWDCELHPWGEVYHGDGMLLRPLTYMNNSGWAVRKLVERFDLALTDILVIYDDVDLPLGEVRLRPKGGPGSHLGMQSVLFALGTEDVPRLRIGIGPLPPGMELMNFVLSPPSPSEASRLAWAADLASELAQTFLKSGLAFALDAFSRLRQIR